MSNSLRRNGYTVQVVLGNQVLPDSMITRTIEITKEESQNNQATLFLLVNNPVDFIDAVWGAPVLIDYITATGITRLFTGVVAIPEIDLINRVVKLVCSNNRDAVINSTLGHLLPTIGRYSYEVQGEVPDVATEMKYRMETVPMSLDFDSYNQVHFNSWFAKATPDVTLGAGQIYYREPKVVWQDRTKIKNYQNIVVEYQYTRLYHYQRDFSWTFPYDFCTFLRFQYSLPSVQMIKDAVANAGWKLPSAIIFTSVFPPGTCADGATLLAWNTSSLANRGTYSTTFDSNGNVISDPDGNNVYGFRPFTQQDDLSTIYTIGAEWTGSIRFSQYVIENYNLTVQSTQSIAQFGQVASSVKRSIKDDFDATSWEEYASITAQPADAVVLSGGSYYFNQDTAPDKMTNLILTSIDMAKTEIYSTHRNTFVTAETPIIPYLELSHTLQFNAELVTAKGKVQKITHLINIEDGSPSTEITIALFRSRGSATETPSYAPTRPTDIIDTPTGEIVLGNHYGEDNEAFNGFIGNKLNQAVAGQPPRTNVDEEFRVDTPAIEDAYRKARTLTATPATFNVNIPNDLLEIVFPS